VSERDCKLKNLLLRSRAVAKYEVVITAKLLGRSRDEAVQYFKRE